MLCLKTTTEISITAQMRYQFRKNRATFPAGGRQKMKRGLFTGNTVEPCQMASLSIGQAPQWRSAVRSSLLKQAGSLTPEVLQRWTRPVLGKITATDLRRMRFCGKQCPNTHQGPPRGRSFLKTPWPFEDSIEKQSNLPRKHGNGTN